MKNIIQIILAVTLTASSSFGVNKRKGLYIGSTGMPTEMSSSTDYATAKGFSFANSDNTLIDEDSGIMRFYTNAVLAGSIDTSGNWDFPFHIAVGTDASVNTALLGNFSQFATTDVSLTGVIGNIGTTENSSNSSFTGLQGMSQVAGTNGKANLVFGAIGESSISSSATGTLATKSYGGFFGSNFTGTGTIPNTYGLFIYNYTDNGFGTPVVTNAFGQRIEAYSTGTVTTYKALSIQDATGVGATSWALASDGGNSYFAGATRLGGSTAPTNSLSVTGTANVSTQVTTPIVSGGTTSGDTLTLKSNDSAWPRTARTTTDMLTIGTSFTYPTGSAAAFNSIISSPTISSIDVANPNISTFQIQPVFGYTLAQSWGLSPKSGLQFVPTFTSSVGAAGSDSAIFQGMNSQPQLNLSSGPRTWSNLWGIAGDPRLLGTAGTVTTMIGVRSRGSTISGTTATTMTGFISDFSNPTGATTTTYRGLHIAPSFVGTITNFEGVKIDAQTTPATTNIGFYQLGTAMNNRFIGKTIVGTDAAPSAYLEIESPASTGTVVPDFLITGAANTALTATTARNTFVVDPGSQQWATGNITGLQYFTYFKQPTMSFVGASSSLANYTVAVQPPTGGTNATIGNAIALGVIGTAVANTTNAYGLSVTQPSGATNNYAATFSGRVGFGTVAPTANVQISAGSATAGTAPLKLTSGPYLTAVETGALEYDGYKLALTSLDTANRQDVVTSLLKDVTTITTSTTSAETTHYSSTIPSNTFGANRTLRMKILGNIKNNKGTSGTITYRVKYGGTTIYTAIHTLVDSLQIRAVEIKCEIQALNSATSQVASCESKMGGLTTTAGSGAAMQDHYYAQYRGLTLNTATDLGLVFTIEMSASSTNFVVITDSVIVEYL